MNQLPLVSIGIPLFNESTKLIKTVISALEQTYSNNEVIISDNFSTDDTWDMQPFRNDSRIKLYRQEKNIGPNSNF